MGGRLSADRELGLDELDSKLEDMERELLELNANSERLTRRCDCPPDALLALLCKLSTAWSAETATWVWSCSWEAVTHQLQ